MGVQASAGTAVPPDGDRGTGFPRVAGPPVHVQLLGPVRLSGLDAGEHILPTRRAKAVLGYLVLARGRAVQRATLATLLWERSGEAEARASLRRALAEVTTAFRHLGGARLEAGREQVRLDVAACEVDVHGLADGTPTGLALEPAPPALMEDLHGLGTGWDAWLAAERAAVHDRLRSLRQAALDAALADAPSEPGVAIRAARHLLALDDTHEGAWRALMRLLAEEGDRTRALQEYERCRATLRNTLDVEPSPATRALAQSIRAGCAPPPVLAPLPVRWAEAAPAERPLRIGVLPFTATGLGEAVAALALAYARDTAMELARFRRFDIVAPMALAERGAQRGGRDAGAELGLDYLIDGSIRDAGEASTLAVSLVDVSWLARPVWCDGVLLPADVHHVDGNALERLVARLDPAILAAGGGRPPAGATGAVLRAIPLLYSMRRDRYEMAGELLAEAIVRDPESAVAAAWGAHWHVFHIGQGWARDPIAELQEAERLAVLAMRLDPENAEGFGIYGHVCAFLHKDFDTAAHYLDRSLEMNPHQASIWALSAPTQCYLGQPGEARRRLAQYRALAPNHPHAPIFGPMFTMASVFAGEYDRAIEVGTRAVRMSPDFTNGYKPLLAAMGQRRQRREARPFLEGLLAREPGFTVQEFARTYPFKRAEDRERYVEGLRLAGVPKG